MAWAGQGRGQGRRHFCHRPAGTYLFLECATSVWTHSNSLFHQPGTRNKALIHTAVVRRGLSISLHLVSDTLLI